MTTPFIFFAAFFPRWTLLLVWLFGTMPANDTPFAVDVLCALLAPRLLVAWWMFCMDMHPLLIAVFVLLELSEKFGGRRASSSSSSSSSRRKRKN
jgi:hypothetical protein